PDAEADDLAASFGIGGHGDYSLIVTAKMNDIDPQAWLADVLAMLPDLTASQVSDLLPWNWHPPELRQAA
ncbi:transposase domain-containing protein, partial [Meridianimarinicoccus zhengii]|uniref:transposase domain-containing protein n=1 Tax=Meridianimarinicoccus zhengii TaxID=2056810 RepID=UPI0013A6F225